MHVKWLSKLTKLCGEIVLLQDKNWEQKKVFKGCEKKRKNRFQVDGDRRAHAQSHPDNRMPRLHMSEVHWDIRMITIWNRFRTAPDSVACCSGYRTLQSFSCRRKAYPELRHSDIRIYPDMCKCSLSPNQPVYPHVAQERSQVFWQVAQFFNFSARTGLTEQTFGEKSWGHRPFWDFFFQKTTFFSSNACKTGMLVGQHFVGELQRNLNHVFLRQFENGFWHIYVQKPTWRSHLKVAQNEV